MKLLTENSDWHKYYDYLEEYDEYTVLRMLANGKNLWVPLINPAIYQQALNEFTRFGKLEKFPTKYIYQWMGIIMKNTAIIRAITSIAGHDMGFPTDSIIDAFFNSREEFDEYKKSLVHKGSFSPDFGWMGQEEDDFDEGQEVDDDEAAGKYLEDNGYYDKMTLPDGSSAWSDFGIRPLEEIIFQYNDSLEPEKVLVLINKALDVTHQRGDLASAFIKGGRSTLSSISNKGYVNESIDNMGNNKYNEYIKHFKPLFDLMRKEEGVSNARFPVVVLHTDIQKCKPIMIKTGHFDPNTDKIHIFLCDNNGLRSIRDVAATFTHECTHYIQKLRGDLGKNGYNSQKITEDNELIKLEIEAYLKSGLYLRKYREKLGAYN